MSLLLPISFSFIWNPSLPILSPSLSLSPWLILYYASLSNHVIWHISSAFSLSIFSSFFFCSPVSLSLSLYPSPSSFPSLPLYSDSWSAPLCSVTLPEPLTHMHTVTVWHTGTPCLRLAGLFELCGIALRDCVWSCMGHVRHVLMGVHMHVHVCMCDRECLQKCEIEDLRQLHLPWGCDFKA